MDNKDIVHLIKDIVGENNVKTDELMSNHTSFKVGGPADIFVIPNSAEQISAVLDIAQKHSLPAFIMGNGTNLIVKDNGIRGIVIKLFDNFNQYRVDGDSIKAQAGILLSKISKVALELELAGLEFASGIPGTLGGAVAMNAGAYGGEMKDVVVKTEYLDRTGVIKVIEGKGHEFGYRTSLIQREGGVVLWSEMKLKKGNKEDIKALMDDLNKRRKDKQPLHMPSAGSVFKRPEGYFAGKLIEDSELRGFRMGGAEVSPMHCGFIVNTGSATAQDIINLIEYIQDTVKGKFGVELKTEVRIVGEA